MKILVLADTHASSLWDIPRKIRDAIHSADLVIHAGDFVELEVWQELGQLKELRAVHGNMDSEKLKAVLPPKRIIEIEGNRIGVVHGSGSPWGIEERVKSLFEPERVDIIVYGHSHQSQNKVTDSIMFFNPGKAAESFGILIIERGKKVRGEIISSW